MILKKNATTDSQVTKIEVKAYNYFALSNNQYRTLLRGIINKISNKISIESIELKNKKTKLLMT